jgi:hypothetical protein
MKFSLLYQTEDKPAVCQILYDLSVDRAVHISSPTAAVPSISSRCWVSP